MENAIIKDGYQFVSVSSRLFIEQIEKPGLYFCPYCYQPIDSVTASSCSICGKRLVTSSSDLDNRIDENLILINEDPQQMGRKYRRNLLYLIGMMLVLIGFFSPMGKLMDEDGEFDGYIVGYTLILDVPELGILFTLPIFISSVVGIMSCFVDFPNTKLIRIISLITTVICTFITFCIVSLLTIMGLGVQVKGTSFFVIFTGCVAVIFFFLKKNKK